jgi:hypothetical protein
MRALALRSWPVRPVGLLPGSLEEIAKVPHALLQESVDV